MPARIVIVHDDNQFLEAATTTLRDAGYDVAAFADTLSALDALNHANKVEVLITRVEYPEGQPHGLALARMARSRRPQVKVLFTAKAEHRPLTEGLGGFLALTTTPEEVLAYVRLLDGG
jgi:DNA-binding NtrC family response regulator